MAASGAPASRSWSVFPETRGDDWLGAIVAATGLLAPLVRLVQDWARTPPLEEAGCAKEADPWYDSPAARACCWAGGALWLATTNRENGLDVYFHALCAPPGGEVQRHLPSRLPFDEDVAGHDMVACVPTADEKAPGAPCLSPGHARELGLSPFGLAFCVPAFGFWVWRLRERAVYTVFDRRSAEWTVLDQDGKEDPGLPEHRYPRELRTVLELPPAPAACAAWEAGLCEVVARGADVCVAADGGWLVFSAGRPCARLALLDRPVPQPLLCIPSPRGMATLAAHFEDPATGAGRESRIVLAVRAEGLSALVVDFPMADALRLLPEPGGYRVAVLRRSGRVDLLRAPF